MWRLAALEGCEPHMYKRYIEHPPHTNEARRVARNAVQMGLAGFKNARKLKKALPSLTCEAGCAAQYLVQVNILGF